MTYEVEYLDDGVSNTTRVTATSAGCAFAAVQLRYPEAIMVRCRAGVLSVSPVHGWTDYDAPKVQRPVQRLIAPCRAPKRDERDGIFPFYDEALGKGYQP